MTDRPARPIVPVRLMEIAEVIGPAAALRLAEVHGGQECCYVPKKPKVTHPFVQVIGWEAMQAMAAYFGGGRVDIPRNCYANSHKVRIHQLRDQGLSHRQIAAQLGCTERWVRAVVNGGGGGSEPAARALQGSLL